MPDPDWWDKVNLDPEVMAERSSEMPETDKPHIERDYDDQSIVYRIADLLEEIVAELKLLREPKPQ